MKKLFLVLVAVSVMSNAFSQQNRVENRKTRGFYNITQFSLLTGSPFSERGQSYFDSRNANQVSPSFTMINGGMINEHWGIGVGVGFEIFDRNLFPFFLDVRYTVRDTNISPFFAFKVGYAFSGHRRKSPPYVSNAYFKKHGGFMLNPEIGVKIPLNVNSDLLITVAYRYQEAKSTITQNRRGTWSRPTHEHFVSMNRLSFGVAIMFR